MESTDEVYYKYRKNKVTPPLWDSFQDPPSKRANGSAVNWSKLSLLLKLLKLFTYIVVFVIILMTAIISKVSFVIMTAQIGEQVHVSYWNKLDPANHYIAELPLSEQIAWVWALIISFAAPEILCFLRSLRICVFKDVKSPTCLEALLVISFELLHVVGLAILTFYTFPQVDSIRAALLCNSTCFISAVLTILRGTHLHWKSLATYSINILALIAQASAFVVWPTISKSTAVQTLAGPLILISFRWWENYVNAYTRRFNPNIISMVHRTRSRYQTYLYLSPIKIVLFAVLGIFLHGQSTYNMYFTIFKEAWQPHEIVVNVSSKAAMVTTKLTTATTLPHHTTRLQLSSSRQNFVIQSNPNAVIYVMLLQVLSSYLCYIFGKFACKIKIQEFSYALPLCLASPFTVAIIVTMTRWRGLFNQYLPDYLSFKISSSMNRNHFMNTIENYWELLAQMLMQQHLWLGVLWWLSQLWITKHVWCPKNDKNLPTEKLFICPWYSGFLVEQCVTMNRRIVDWNEEYLAIKSEMYSLRQEAVTCDILESDKIPQLIVCATMWHETQEEMMEFLKSIVRLDEDQCARRMARVHINEGKPDDEYYELERTTKFKKLWDLKVEKRKCVETITFVVLQTICYIVLIMHLFPIKANVFFDDAFILDDNLMENPENPPLNEYVKLFITSIEKAAFEVHSVPIKLKPPIKIKTPYGGRLVWTLPGRSKLVTHLKNKDKIRHKKRWSQVMYMYYLLGFRIMELEDVSAKRKTIIAENTFILALDGDIDFQPRAVQLLIDRMKAIDELGAACGRIHPVGRGPLVWYQIFEYAIGHWLQKATEHVIGCVLCSPGCFSLFRATALMENGVMKKYTAVSQEPIHYVQYDQGEDRWLCTLILKQGFRVEYSAASDAYTHSPEIFNEFYNQRRRWIPSTIANILDLLSDADLIVKNNSSISKPYILYQAMLMVGTILGPGTIFLMMVGAAVTVFSIDIWAAFLWNFIPLLAFTLSCLYFKQNVQLLLAFVISSIYCLVMMAVLIGIIIQIIYDGPMAPASLFFLIVVLQIVITGLFHPQEMKAMICGFIYYITIPSMYMLLLIYAVFNMNDVSWGTREEEDTVRPPNAENHSYPPGWINDPLLHECEFGEISLQEKRFWKDLIKLYLKPLFHTSEKKTEIADSLRQFRNLFAFAFVMINAIFVLIVLLLQLKKEYLHLKWPIDAIDYITYDDINLQIYVYRQYKQLDPIGFCFVLLFGIILIIQFIAMFFHRFATFSQLLAATKLDWFRSSNVISDEDAAQELHGNAVHIARQLQRPKRLDDDDDDDSDNYGIDYGDNGNKISVDVERNVRRKTLFHLHENFNRNHYDYSDLPSNFERRFLGDVDINGKHVPLSRKSLMMLNRTRNVAKRRLTEQNDPNTDVERRTYYEGLNKNSF